MSRHEIKIAGDTITKDELSNLADWIKSGARLTMGELTKQFESEFSKYIGTKYAVFVNSGSSANLIITYALLKSDMLRNKRAIISAVSWVTTLAPFLQLGFQPYLCEIAKDSLGIDPNYFEDLCKKHNPSILILVHVLGHPNKMADICAIADKYHVILVEDACEALGSTYHNKKVGSLGLAGSFSFYYSHHISTIEGGMATTNNRDLYNAMLSMRSHGWGRDIEPEYLQRIKGNYGVDECREFYTFYYPGFNLRSTDLSAFLGLSQIKKIDHIAKKREENFNYYKKLLSAKYYYQKSKSGSLSSFAFGTFVKNRLEVSQYLKKNGIETRPLICGSLGRQPFWIKKFGVCKFQNADIVHENGIYLPNHLGLGKNEIEYVCNKFSDIAEPLSL